MRSRTTLAAALAITLCALGATLGGARPAQAHSTGHAATAAPKTVSIMIKGYMFMPASVTVNPGDTVIWTNTDTAKHDATSLSGPAKFGGPLIGKGETYTWVATSSGDYAYYCSVHPDMKATLTVAAAAPAPAPVVVTKAPVAKTTAPTKSVTRTPARTTTTTTTTTTTKAAAPVAAGGSGTSAGTTTVVRRPAAAAPQQVAAAPVTTQAVQPASQDDALDPTLLIVALAIGAAVFALLSLGPRAPRMVKVVVPPTPADDGTA